MICGENRLFLEGFGKKGACLVCMSSPAQARARARKGEQKIAGVGCGGCADGCLRCRWGSKVGK